MSLHYKLTIDQPSTHRIQIEVSGQWPGDVDLVDLYLPVWAPGSYLVREYSKNMISFRAHDDQGRPLHCEKTSKNTWTLDRQMMAETSELKGFSFTYEMYAFEVSVRNSFINDDHAFLHLPDLLVTSDDLDKDKPTLELFFPGGWSKVHTGLDDLADERNEFKYGASNFDELIDTPIEIGCHDSTGFKAANKDHYVIAYGKLPTDYSKLVDEMKQVTEAICDFWGEVPYERYYYMTHFIPGVYGGLEHHNSTVMQFDPFELETRSGWINYLGLVSHEFFHTWNVKRIRPLELVDFDYNNENYTRMHWLTEGLTSFVDDVILYSCGLCTTDEYLGTLLKGIQRLEQTTGRKFQSLEESSFDTWIKLYRPNENSINSAVSYYLKGDLAFFCLSAFFSQHSVNMQDFCRLLWKAYKSENYVGLCKEDVLSMIEELSDQKTREAFDVMISTTEELPFTECCELVGIEVEKKRQEGAYLGVTWELKENAVFVKSVALDGPSYKGGLNARDEIIAADGLRINRTNYDQWGKSLKVNQVVDLTVSRLGVLKSVKLVVDQYPERISALKLVDQARFDKAHKF